MAASSSSSALPPVRSWRTAFLTLRDETTTSPPRASVPDLLHNLVFSNSAPLIAAAAELPPQEVASDVLFLIELVADADQVGENAMAAYSLTFHLINDISRRVSLDINASYWKRILDSFGKIIGVSIGKASLNGEGTGNPSRIRPVMNCFETLRILIAAHLRISSLSENIELVKFLGSNIARFHAELSSFSDLSGTQRYPAVAEKRIPRSGSLWEVQTLCFTMLGEAFSRVGSLIPIDTWQSVIEVPSFVAALRLFLNYGLASCRPQMTYKTVGEKEKEVSSLTSKTSSSTDGKVDHKPYRPPHLRRNDAANLKKTKDLYAPALSDHGSDSEYSDSDGSVQDNDSIRRSKVRVSALLCLQDLCQADPKAFTTQWTMLLPTNDVLESRKFDATLMTCLLFDPYLKARLASASTLAVMLDGPSSVSLQVAEYKDSSKRGSYTSLSSSLGQILMQLHKGVIHLVMRETHSGLLASLLKILMLLISSTPYARMPEDLLPTVIINLQAKVEGGFPSNNDDTSLLATAISCLAGALSTSSSSLKVQEILAQEIEGWFYLHIS
ncbi:hypothetical protein CRG98_010121 [Punica granatum]|uniref:DUF4042 domain-containing protein n=1 Tax=Punica granatum TaxID=22663 RepID=A0A2I0KLY0_PUNGR|nr:hypothetical protein CRG98_010121 [Punica granatum]